MIDIHITGGHGPKLQRSSMYVAIFRVKRTSSEWPPTRKSGGSSSFPTGRALTDPSR